MDEGEYCPKVIGKRAGPITYNGCFLEFVCDELSCPHLDSEHDKVRGIDGIERRFCLIEGRNPNLSESAKQS